MEEVCALLNAFLVFVLFLLSLSVMLGLKVCVNSVIANK